jgi:hypothetical protein
VSPPHEEEQTQIKKERKKNKRWARFEKRESCFRFSIFNKSATHDVDPKGPRENSFSLDCVYGINLLKLVFLFN